MRRLACWMLLFALSSLGAAWGASSPPKPSASKPTPPPTPFQSCMNYLERNATMGAALLEREGSADEMAMVQKLADRGVTTARGLVTKDPQSAEAYYVLGSWLLYGYRVTQVERLSVDEHGEEHKELVKVVVQSINDSPQEGLDCLATASRLAPKNVTYLLDYGAALYDWEQPELAMQTLKRVWAEDITLTPAQKMQVSLLMSDITASLGDLSESRSWLYRALSDLPDGPPIVARLRTLDSMEIEAAPAAEEETTESEEVAPDESGEEEVTPAPEASGDEEVSPAPSDTSDDEVAPAPSDAGDDEVTPAPSDTEGDEVTPAPEEAPATDEEPGTEVGD